MGKFKEIIEFERKNMPDYQFKFLYHRLMPGFIFIFVGTIVVAIIAIIAGAIDNMLLGIIPVAIWAVITFTLLVLFVVFGKKNSKRLLIDRSKQFEEEYALTDLEVAKEILAQNNIIINEQLIGNDEFSRIPLKDCHIIFFCKTMSGAFYFYLVFCDKDTHEPLADLIINKNILTYFYYNQERILNKELLNLFVDNKAEFLRLLFRYNNHIKMQAKIRKR